MHILRASLIGLIVGIGVLAVPAPASAAIDRDRDCDSVAIIKCGSMSEAELRTDAGQGDVPKVFANFGISQNELSGFVDGVVWRDGRVTLGVNGGGRLVATNAVTAGRWDNPKPGMVRIPGTDRAYRMSTSNFTDEGQTAFIKMVDGKFQFAVLKPCGNPVTGNPTPPPTYQCETLRKTQIDRDTYRFTAKGSAAHGAKIVKYRFNFGDGKTREVASNVVEHTYAKPGNYNVRVTIIVEVNGKLVEDTSAGCVEQVTVPPPVKPQQPQFSCDLLTLTDLGDRRVRTSVRYTATGGAVVREFVFDFGDGTPPLTASSGTVEHTYAQDGNYTVQVRLVVRANDRNHVVTSETCKASVPFATPPQPPVTPPPAPPVLPNTGAGTVIGATISTIIGGILAYRLVWLRRFGL